VEVTAAAPFAADILTVSIPTPWPLYTGPSVRVDGHAFEQVIEPARLAAGRWCMRGSVVTVSLPIRANVVRTITITAADATG
jgi:hypothetical protein